MTAVCLQFQDGSEFISAHNDGSFIMWSLTASSTEPMEPPNTPYGPYPCKVRNERVSEHSVEIREIYSYTYFAKIS